MNCQQQTVQIPYLEIFKQQNWPSLLPKKYLINSHYLEIDQDDTQFFISDCTNPDYSKLKIKNQIDDVIQNKLNGQAFFKAYGRTAKDINSAMNKILNVKDLTTAIKMSQFLTEVLDEELECQKKESSSNEKKQIKLNFILREYKDYLESPLRQYRLYFLNDLLVAMCQKVPNHISTQPNENQIKKAEQIGNAVYSAILKIKDVKQKIEDVKLAIDCFISEEGKKGKIFSIEPIYPLHCLSLFEEDQLQKIYKDYSKSIQNAQKPKPTIKYVKSQNQYRQIDLSHYKVGWQLSNIQALDEWKQFIKGK